MRRILVSGVLIALLLPDVSVGQDKASSKAGAQTAAAKKIADQIRKINVAYRVADQKLYEKFKAATSEEKQKILKETRPALQKKFAIQFVELAEQHRGTPPAVTALAAALPLTGRDVELKKQIQDQLLEDHINDKRLVPAIAGLGRDAKLLQQLIENSESREVRGVASYFDVQRLKGRGLTEKNAETVIAAMEKVQKEYGDVELIAAGGRSRGKLGKLIAAELFSFRNLRIGKEAPEIAAADLDGVDFKLSDYRGKVVVLDFWGDW